MIAELPDDTTRVIELGGGTGAITQALLEAGIADEHLLVLELNEELQAHLQRQFPRVPVVLGDARSLPQLVADSGWLAAGRADAIVSGLGLLAMPHPLQRDILLGALSCLRAGTRDVVVHLLHAPDVSAHDLGRLRAMVEAEGAELRPHPVAELALGRLPDAVSAHGGAVSCARLLLPDLLPDVERLVYLDADTLTRQPLDPLWDQPLGGQVLGAVRNVVEPAMGTRLLALGVRDPGRYLMVSRWASREVFVEYLRSHDHRRSHDRIPKGRHAPHAAGFDEFDLVAR
ncbi:MAG: hypothetical protein KY442_01320 [Proteobacteria bacterium]|nr:hypothetical protein [Pseudomonadota bacterium]